VGAAQVTLIDMLSGPAPKRGDIVQSNVGSRRERTWLVLSVRSTKRPARYKVFMARWWELEADMRIRLYRSAERAGGQRVIFFKRHPAKRRLSFEKYISGEL
jgi:hypothetical protein